MDRYEYLEYRAELFNKEYIEPRGVYAYKVYRGSRAIACIRISRNLRIFEAEMYDNREGIPYDYVCMIQKFMEMIREDIAE